MVETGDQVAPKDTREVIMEATFRALSKHGYTDLRLRDIGEEMDMTRQVIHYHFDGKHDLMSAFLAYIIEQYEGSVEVDADAGPREELRVRIDQCIFGPGFEEFSHWERMRVYHDLFSVAKHDGQHRALLDAHYRRIRQGIIEVIEEGIEAGVFAPVEPEAMGSLITDLIHMARERKVSLGQDDAPQAVREAIDAYVLAALSPARSSRKSAHTERCEQSFEEISDDQSQADDDGHESRRQ